MEPTTHATSEEEEVHTAHDATESDSGDRHELQADNQASTHDRDPANGPMSASFIYRSPISTPIMISSYSSRR